MKLRLNRDEKRNINSQILKNALHGEGLYLYRNNTKSDLTLPKPTRSGTRTISQGQEFQGDSYYMQLVRQGLLKLVKELQSPEQQKIAEELDSKKDFEIVEVEQKNSKKKNN